METGAVKWITIGLVAIVFMIMFRNQLRRLIDRLTGLKISKEGIEIKTLETPLGTTMVTNMSVRSVDTAIDGIQGNTFVSRKHGFQISWQDSGKWNPSETYGATLHQQLNLPATTEIPLFILRSEPVGNFRPNVNVLVEPVGSIHIGQYIDQTIQSMHQMNWQIYASSVDEKTQGGLLVFLNTSFTQKLFQFQRIAIGSGRAYVITASQLPPDDQLSVEVREDLRGILNSFRLIN